MHAATLAVVIAIAAAQAPPATGPSAADRAAAVKHMEQSRDAFVKAIDGLNDAQWTYKAGPDRWSIAEVAEHIAISESTILQLITEKVVKGTPATTAKAPLADDKVVAMIEDRTQKAQAPEMLRPTSRWATRQALTKDFLAARQKTIDYVKTTTDDLRGHIAPHPALKELDGHQWLLLLSAHSARHTAQIEEVKTAAGYPR